MSGFCLAVSSFPETWTRISLCTNFTHIAEQFSFSRLKASILTCGCLSREIANFLAVNSTNLSKHQWQKQGIFRLTTHELGNTLLRKSLTRRWTLKYFRDYEMRIYTIWTDASRFGSPSGEARRVMQMRLSKQLCRGDVVTFEKKSSWLARLNRHLFFKSEWIERASWVQRWLFLALFFVACTRYMYLVSPRTQARLFTHIIILKWRWISHRSHNTLKSTRTVCNLFQHPKAL